MAVGDQKVACPSCDNVVDVSIPEGKTVVGASRGHSSETDTLNQLCTSCLDKIHVELV